MNRIPDTGRSVRWLLLWLTFFLCIVPDVNAQRKKKIRERGGEKTVYSYRTEATLRKKSRRPSTTGNHDFFVEKPLEPVTGFSERGAVDLSKPPYFGHRRPVVKRKPSAQRMCRICGIKH